MPHPCAGAIWSSTAFTAEGGFSGLWRAGVECEIAVKLAADIPSLGPGVLHTRESVSSAVGEVMAAIEIVDDRYACFEEREPGPYVWVADDFFGAGIVVADAGAEAGLGLQGLDLSAVKGEMRINGEVVGSGYGRDIINGHPLEALVWLANKIEELRGSSEDQALPLLPAGHVVMLGSVVQTKWVEAGDVVTVSVDGLGSATARFT
jgi:2-keto-4-pentenoate hydratase